MQTLGSNVKFRINKLLQFLPPEIYSKILKSIVIRRTYNKLRDDYRYIRSKLNPHKSARVYIRKGISRMEFFSILNDRKIDYVLLRWWEGLPEMPVDEDMDILIKDEHRNKIDDLITFTDNGNGLKCDIYTLTGSFYGSHKGIPYFQSNMGHDLLKSRRLFKGVYVPSPREYFASLAYHALFHKGKASGIEGFGDYSGAVEHAYSTILSEHSLNIGEEVDINAECLFKWLETNEYIPAEDTLSKLVDIKPELEIFQKRLSSDIRGGELTVFVIRERLVKDKLLEDFKLFLENEYQFEILDIQFLNQKQKDNATRFIRGGKWDKGPFKYSGGVPEAFLVAYDFEPKPLNDIDQKKQSRTTNNNNMLAKYRFRDLITSNRTIKKADYNGVHSSDNEMDAKYYLSFLGGDYLEHIENIVEDKRNYKSINRISSQLI
ncbi:hypothetical protein BC962_2221 [Gillisia mitskevichiae]|uniref:Uncharacterized protein n=1 Tax=Gillisia mitskevichiae TaxID=270921 RepID=A0A495PTM2_9FLAO|nr:hypothetical protein [Gillisia mitskevichiae]RKS53954.1 hypothetical protein BC962_2221 [Gillisia mitskevichiae]